MKAMIKYNDLFTAILQESCETYRVNRDGKPFGWIDVKFSNFTTYYPNTTLEIDDLNAIKHLILDIANQALI